MSYRSTFVNTDRAIINFINRISLPLCRLALFIIFFWFGALKVFDLSPASPMVLELLSKTMPFIAPSVFLFYFGLYEMLIGVTFLIPKLNKLAIVLVIPHLISTMLPLFVMRSLTWSAAFVPTMEGQYIIKNILIIAIATVITAHLTPFSKK